MQRALPAFGAIFLLSTSAMAADVSMPAAFDWTGAYVGLQGGYGFGTSRHTDSIGITSGDIGVSGFLGGAELGWNHQINAIVLGLETDLSYSGISGLTNFPGCSFGGCKTDIRWFGTTRARLGYALDNVLLFASGGLAYGDVHARCCGGYFNTQTKVGWTVGAGAEMALNRNLSVKLEYLYLDLGEVAVPTSVPLNAKVRDNHIIRLGLNYKF